MRTEQKQHTADQDATKHGQAVCGSVDPTRVPPAQSFHAKESPLTREYADPNGALDRLLCDTAEAHVADVRLCGIRGGGSSSFPMGQTAHPAVAAGMVEPGGATSGTLQAIAP